MALTSISTLTLLPGGGKAWVYLELYTSVILTPQGGEKAKYHRRHGHSTVMANYFWLKGLHVHSWPNPLGCPGQWWVWSHFSCCMPISLGGGCYWPLWAHQMIDPMTGEKAICVPIRVLGSIHASVVSFLFPFSLPPPNL